MQAPRRDPLKEAGETITFAALFTLTVTGPVTLIAGIILAGIDQWVEQCSRRTHEQQS